MSANDNDVDFSRGQKCAQNSKNCVNRSNVHEALAMAYRDKSVFGCGYYVEMIGYAKSSDGYSDMRYADKRMCAASGCSQAIRNMGAAP